MNYADRKNINRRAEAVRTKHNRVIVGYVEHMFPKVYDEAKKFYEQLNVKYPQKRDLRKTNEYAWMKTGLVFPQQTGKNDKQVETVTEKPTPHQPESNDEQVETVTEKPTPHQPESNDEQVETVTGSNNIKDTMKLRIPLMTTKDTVKKSIDMSTKMEIDEVPMMTEETLQSMIRDLREDPDLNDIFNDFEMFGNDENILETELETELKTIFSHV